MLTLLHWNYSCRLFLWHWGWKWLETGKNQVDVFKFWNCVLKKIANNELWFALLAKFHVISVADPGGGSGGSGPPPPQTFSDLIEKNKVFKWIEIEILTTKGSHMTINWLIFEKETCVRCTSPLNLLVFFFFFDYSLMIGSSRKAVLPGIWRNTRFRQYGVDSAYDLVLSTG